MVWELEDKVVVATGGAEGIGYAICDKYLEEGAKPVVIVDLNEATGNKAVTTLAAKHGDRVVFIQGDVTADLDRIFTAIVASYKTIQVLVLSAGIAKEISPKKVIDINVTACIEWFLKFQEIMTSDKNSGCGGTVVLLSSIFGFRVYPYAPIYQASKFAIYGFAKAVGHQRNFKKTGIRVLALCPGFTRTSLTTRLRDPNFLESIEEDYAACLKGVIWQDVDAVGTAAVQVFKTAESGSLWVIEGGVLSERKEES